MSGISIQSFHRYEEDASPEWIAFAGTQDTAVKDLDSRNDTEPTYYALKILKWKKEKFDRSMIPGTLSEQLSYLCYCLWSPLNRQIFDLSYLNSRLHRYTVINMCCFNTVKFYTQVYIVFFLTIYVPLEHMYIAKMFPLFYGCSWQIIMCGIFKLAFFADNLAMVFDYVAMGLLQRVPWNKCYQESFNITDKQVICLSLKKFYQYSNNNDTTYEDGVYKLNGTYFQAAQIFYVMVRNNIKEGAFILNLSDFYWIYYFIMWVAAVLFYRQLFKKYIWKIFACLMYILCFVYLATIIFIQVTFMTGRLEELPLKDIDVQKVDSEIRHHHYFIPVVGSTSAPPILHLLNARKRIKVRPGRDSIIFFMAILMFYIFQYYTYVSLKDFCDAKAGIEVQLNNENSFAFFYLWPMFFRNFGLSPFFTRAFFVLVLLLEFLTFVITYQCLVEVFSCEWKRIKRWQASFMLTIVGLLFTYYTTAETRFFLYIYGQSIVTCVEILTIVFFYPYGRLIEDMHFYYGTDMSKFLKTVFILSLIYYVLELEDESSSIIWIYTNYIHPVPDDHLNWISCIPLIPIILGALYKIFKISFNAKAKWISLIKPIPQWGPIDHTTRQFRKNFDARTFIHSLGSRYICRYILKTTQAMNYRINVQYEREDKGKAEFSKDKSLPKNI